MSASKIAISIDSKVLAELDRWVAKKKISSRSRAISDAVSEKLARMDRGRLARECAKLDVKYEQKLADLGLAAERGQWPEY